MMTTLTVNIENKKTEKAVKAVLDALGLNYSVEGDANPKNRVLNKAEKKIYNNLNRSFNEIKLHKEGKIKLQDAKAGIAEIKKSI